MKNFLFISPNFPENYWMFCRELKKNGLNVLGIGDQPYEELSQGLKDSLDEYYKVSSLENEEEVYRAVAFLIFKHGRIDWLESNNEYWLERDARLRTAFHITSGFQEDDIPRIKYKSKMKAYYAQAGIPTARYHLVDTLEECEKFIKEVGYPVVVKPDKPYLQTGRSGAARRIFPNEGIGSFLYNGGVRSRGGKFLRCHHRFQRRSDLRNRKCDTDLHHGYREPRGQCALLYREAAFQ